MTAAVASKVGEPGLRTGDPGSPGAYDDDSRGSGNNYKVMLVGVRKKRYPWMRSWLKRSGIRIPRGLSDLELSVIVHRRSGIEPVRAPFRYFELHPLHTSEYSMDDSVVALHEYKGVNYATIEPDESSQAAAQNRAGIYNVVHPFVFPGMSRNPLLVKEMQDYRFDDLINSLWLTEYLAREAKASGKPGDKSWAPVYIRSNNALYAAIYSLFGDEIKSYKSLDRRVLAPPHTELHVFSGSIISGEPEIMEFGPFFGQLAAYFVGTDAYIRKHVDNYWLRAFNLAEAGLFAVSGSVSGYALSSPGFGMPFAGLSALMFFDVVFRASNLMLTCRESGIVGEAYAGIRHALEFLPSMRQPRGSSSP